MIVSSTFGPRSFYLHVELLLYIPLPLFPKALLPDQSATSSGYSQFHGSAYHPGSTGSERVRRLPFTLPTYHPNPRNPGSYLTSKLTVLTIPFSKSSSLSPFSLGNPEDLATPTSLSLISLPSVLSPFSLPTSRS